jgi:hypothetical protein
VSSQTDATSAMVPPTSPSDRRLPPVGKRMRDLSQLPPGAEPTTGIQTPRDAAWGYLVDAEEPQARRSRGTFNGQRLRWCLSCDRRLPDKGQSAFCQGKTRRTPGYCRPLYENELQNIRRMLDRPDEAVNKDLLRDLHHLAYRAASSRTAFLQGVAAKEDTRRQLDALSRDVAALTTRIRNDLPNPPKRRP